MKELKFNLTVQFNPETEEIESYVVELEGVSNKVPKKTTTKKVSTKKEKDPAMEGLIIKREVNKLILSPDLIEALNADPEMRFSIQYQNMDGKLVPLFGSDFAFKDNNGNKLAKAGSIAFRGKNNEVLAEFGDDFTLEPYKEGIYMMIGDKTPNNLDLSVEKAVEKIQDIEVIGDETYEIEELDSFIL